MEPTLSCIDVLPGVLFEVVASGRALINLGMIGRMVHQLVLEESKDCSVEWRCMSEVGKWNGCQRRGETAHYLVSLPSLALWCHQVSWDQSI